MSDSAQGGPVRVEPAFEGAVWRVFLDRPKGNILDGEMTRALHGVFDEAKETAALKAIVIEGEGKHFSFGASVEEHLPATVQEMLETFHGLFRRILEAERMTFAAVRGQCLGGGLELAAFCDRVFAAPTAMLGQPEIVLGVLAPVASVLLPERIGPANAIDLCLSGRSVPAEDALRMGLVDVVAEDPSVAALSYIEEQLLPRSASSLRMAKRATLVGYRDRIVQGIAEAERIYLQDLMATKDAVEGIQAFTEKRKAKWQDQ